MKTYLQIAGMAAFMAAGLFTAAPALAEDPPALQVSMPGDETLDCTGISREIARMESIITISDEAQQRAENTSTGISIAKAVGGFLIGSVPGAIGVMAVGHVAGEAAESKANSAAALESAAAQRRSLMIGLYNGRGCKGPIHSLRAVRSAAIDPKTARNAERQAAAQEAAALSAIEPAAGGHGYKIMPHHVTYND